MPMKEPHMLCNFLRRRDLLRFLSLVDGKLQKILGRADCWIGEVGQWQEELRGPQICHRLVMRVLHA